MLTRKPCNQIHFVHNEKISTMTHNESKVMGVNCIEFNNYCFSRMSMRSSKSARNLSYNQNCTY